VDNDENIGLFDLDGSLADYDGQLLADLEKLRSPIEERITHVRPADDLPHIKARMDLIKRQPGWWANLPLLEKGALRKNSTE